jgi:hypothetical protein
VNIRRWWSTTPRYFTRLEEMRWHGLSFEQILASKLADGGEPSPGVHDLSAGAWRNWAFARPGDWPAVARSFERRKILCPGEGGGVLWKFSGLGGDCDGIQSATERTMQQMQELAGRNFAPAALDARLGFIGMPWMEGARLTRNDREDPETVNCIGRYIATVAKPGLSHSEARDSIKRLEEMLYWNVRESLGEEMADRALRLTTGVEETDWTYGDGRVAPHEWVRTRSGRIFKTDGTGHSLDHTVVGTQSVLWDVAGAIVEWDLNHAQVEVLKKPLLDQPIRIDFEALKFYEAAYAAFRLGILSIGMMQEADDRGERARLLGDAKRYRRQIVTLAD